MYNSDTSRQRQRGWEPGKDDFREEEFDPYTPEPISKRNKVLAGMSFRQ